MPVDLSVKRVPDELADQLRERAKRHHRSLQGELRAILENAAADKECQSVSGGWMARERATATSPSAPSGWRIAPQSESALMIREDRDDRTFGVRDLYAYVATLGQGTPDESARWIREDRSSIAPARRPAKPARQ